MQCNVYEVEVTISQIDGYREGQPSYTKKENVLAISEDAARKKTERQFVWELRDKINKKSYCVSYKSKLLIENVVY